MEILAVIPARGGSKGVPRKNIRRLGNKPLIYYTIEAAREVFDDEQICVSTDDKEIKKIVEQTGLNVPFLRPPELATDTSSSKEVLLHALEYYQKQGRNIKTVVLLQPTSPFRSGTHIKEAMELFNPSLDKVVSVCETKSNPYYVLFEENEEGYLVKSKPGDFKRRQECPKVWELNGAIYIIDASFVKKKEIEDQDKIVKYVMDEKSSVDIDTELDWKLAECLTSSSS